MRVSVYPEDTGYHPLTICLSVALDGRPVNHCVTADDETGECICYKLDDKGHVVVSADGNLQLVTLTGKVVIDIDRSRLHDDEMALTIEELRKKYMQYTPRDVSRMFNSRLRNM